MVYNIYMKILDTVIKKSDLQNATQVFDGPMVKGVVDIEKGILVEDEDTVSIYGKCSDHKGQYIKVEKNKDFDEKDAPEEPLFTIAWSNGGTTDNESLDSSELMTSEPTTTP